MQNEVTILPTVCLNSPYSRKKNPNSRILPGQSKTHSTCENAGFPFPNRKRLHPLHENPYGNNARCYVQSDFLRQSSKSAVTQRIVSAKMLRIKELQNQLTDAHYHLNELANENRLLKTLQKRQDSALRQYEGTSAELPRIINSHHEELRIIQSKYKKLKAQQKSTCEILKDKENELHSLQTQNKHLIQLSKDRHLGEREKLQLQVSDLNYRISQQDETIKTLNRKLALETKYLKHQLHLEVMKHKETQKLLQEASEKLKNADDLDSKKRRLLCNNQLNSINKRQNIASQSLTNLGDNSINFNFPKLSCKLKTAQADDQDRNLPNSVNEESKDGKFETSLELENNQPLDVPKTETMESLLQVRNFRLQKPPLERITTFGNRVNEQIESEEDNISHHLSNATKLKNIRDDNQYHFEDEPQNNDQVEKEDEKSFPTQLEEVKERIVPTGNMSEDEEKIFLQEIDAMVLASQSRELHARLTRDEEDDYDIVKLSLDLESKTGSLAIEDIDKLINEQLQLTEFPDVKDSVGTFEYANDLPKSDSKLKRNSEIKNHPSRIPLLNAKLKNLDHEESIKYKSEIKSNIEMNGHATEQSAISLISTKSDSEVRNIDDINSELQGQILPEVSNMDNIGISKERKLSIKHSISEESEQEVPEVIETEDSPDSLHNTRSKDLTNHEKNSESEDGTKSSTPDVKINYSKEKLLAAMKAIDDNDNVEFLDDGSRKNSLKNRTQITENLFRGLPSHSRKKEIIRDLFEDGKLEKSRGCKKMH